MDVSRVLPSVLVAALALAAGCNSLTGASGLTVTGGAGGTTATGGAGTGATSSTTSATTTTTQTGGAGNGSTGTTTTTTTADPCSGVTCSGQGTCKVEGGAATCTCNPGFHPNGLACDQDQTCTGTTCTGCAHCKVIGGIATCTCPTGYVPQGNGCVLSPNPCDTTTCDPGFACVPEAHCSPLGACVEICDCSNCGNCDLGAGDHRWDDQQEYCGAAPDQSPATKTCNTPCPPGLGCIPFSPSICWPMEGCFSL